MKTMVKETHQPKVHFSEYLRTGNKPEEDDKPTETTQPEPKETY